MIVKLLTEHHLEFLSLKGGCRGWSESTLVKMSNCLKSHVTAQMYNRDNRKMIMLWSFSNNTLVKSSLYKHDSLITRLILMDPKHR